MEFEFDATLTIIATRKMDMENFVDCMKLLEKGAISDLFEIFEPETEGAFDLIASKVKK